MRRNKTSVAIAFLLLLGGSTLLQSSDPPDEVTASFEASGSGFEECTFQGGFQEITFNIEASFDVVAANPVLTGDLATYDLVHKVGTVRFFGTAVDSFFGDVTTLNFDRTQELDLQTVAGGLEISTTTCDDAYIHFPIPNSGTLPESIYIQYTDLFDFLRDTVNMPYPWNAGVTCLSNNYDVAASFTDHSIGCGIAYAALGDSFSSGEGARAYEPDTDTGGPPKNKCHRSTRAYPTKVRVPDHSLPVKDEVATAPQLGAKWDFVACSAAKFENVVFGGTGQYNEAAQLDQGVVDEGTDLVTITIGGNDLGFGGILKFCMRLGDCRDEVIFPTQSAMTTEEYITHRLEVVKQLNQLLYAEIKLAAPNAAVVVLGYPHIVPISHWPGCFLPFSDDDLKFLSETGIRLNAALVEATAAAGVHFQHRVPLHFEGHDPCGAPPWINGLVITELAESFHPNALGHVEYAKLANDYLRGKTPASWPHGFFPSGLPMNPPPTAPAPARGGAPPAPSVGPLELMPDAAQPCETNGRFVREEVVRLQGDGFTPSTSVALSIESIDGPFSVDLGTSLTDGTGALDEIITIPLTTPAPGLVAIRAVGEGGNGEPRLLIETAEVGTSFVDDGDSDGTPDICDSCPSVNHPDQTDSDGDGAGDVCDPCPQDPDDDLDGDGICAGVDSCPLDSANDSDGDGVCADVDNCPLNANAEQSDSDGDGRGDACEGIPCHSLSLTARQPADGQVASTSSNCELDKFQAGSFVQLEAFPADGIVFTGWTGDVSSTSNPLDLVIGGDLTVVGQFCSDAFDGDGDLVADACDNCPLDVNPYQIDTDLDGDGDACDLDDDDDGVPDGSDCSPLDDQAWMIPGEVGGLQIAHDPIDGSLLQWNPPASPGAASVAYDTLRAEASSSFLIDTLCVESSDDTDTEFTETGTPDLGAAFYYLVRATNACPDGDGPLGTDSDGQPRMSIACR